MLATSLLQNVCSMIHKWHHYTAGLQVSTYFPCGLDCATDLHMQVVLRVNCWSGLLCTELSQPVCASQCIKMCQSIFSISQLYPIVLILLMCEKIEKCLMDRTYQRKCQLPVTISSEHVSVEILAVRTKIDTRCHFFSNQTWMPWLSVEPRWPFGGTTSAFPRKTRYGGLCSGPGTGSCWALGHTAQSHEVTKTQRLRLWVQVTALKFLIHLRYIFSHVQTQATIYVVSMQNHIGFNQLFLSGLTLLRARRPSCFWSNSVSAPLQCLKVGRSSFMLFRQRRQLLLC